METLLEGKISVKAALLSPYREVEKIIIESQKKDRDTNFIERKAKEKNISIEKMCREEIDALCQGKTHGGIIAYVKERQFQTLESIIEKASFLAIVEGVEDPFNFGQICRTLHAAGVDALLLPPRNWTTAASTLAKASAGASEFLPMVVCEDYDIVLKELKKKQMKIVCAQRDDDAKVIYDYNFKQKACICIGGEKRGLSKTILENSDQNVYIPYQNDFKNALGAASAATIIAYEVLRQRR